MSIEDQLSLHPEPERILNYNPDAPMTSFKDKFLRKLIAADEIIFGNLVSNVVSIKKKFGGGGASGAGRLYELFVVEYVNNYVNDYIDGCYAMHIGIPNNSFIPDIIVTDNKIISLATMQERIINVIRQLKKFHTDDDLLKLENKISELLGINWIGISLKDYQEKGAQLTTSALFRSFLNENAYKSNASLETIDIFYEMLKKLDAGHNLILALNTYDYVSEYEKKKQRLTRKLSAKGDKTRTKARNALNELVDRPSNGYALRIVTFDKKPEEIIFKQNRKLSQYETRIDGSSRFKVLYGGQTENAFQRGIWALNDGLEIFKTIKTGNYQHSNIARKIISMGLSLH